MKKKKTFQVEILPISCLNDSETRGKGPFGIKNPKNFRGWACSWTPLETCVFGARLGNLSVFNLDSLLLRISSTGLRYPVYKLCSYLACPPMKGVCSSNFTLVSRLAKEGQQTRNWGRANRLWPWVYVGFGQQLNQLNMFNLTKV